jgi:hypothetical protein
VGSPEVGPAEIGFAEAGSFQVGPAASGFFRLGPGPEKNQGGKRGGEKEIFHTGYYPFTFTGSL